MAIDVVTGGAGFIGSHLVRALLERGVRVRVIDDFSSGKRENLAEVMSEVELFEGSICDRKLVEQAVEGADHVFHQAAVASVPRSVADPLETNRVNVEGTLNVFLAARDSGAKRVIFASSSAVYGEADACPIGEDTPTVPLSPYGVSKLVCEQYGAAFTHLYGLKIVGLRYFNVFGPRQDPNSDYAAVIPLFISRLLDGKRPIIFGDGAQTRDFCYVGNIVEANLRARDHQGALSGVFNIGTGKHVSVRELAELLNEVLDARLAPEYQAKRPGDILHSYARIDRATAELGYRPETGLKEGLRATAAWFREHAPAGQG